MSATPYVTFEPAWNARLGPLREQGQGILKPHVFRQRDLIDEFSVLLGDFKLTVFPPEGKICLDSRVVCQNPHLRRLVWYRRMEMEKQTGGDDSTRPPQCAWYGVGLENNVGKFGYRIYHDGRIKLGI